MSDDYDDYFDDIDFNDDVFTAMDAEETKFIETQAPVPPPATKKQKTTKGWVARPGSQASDLDVVFDGVSGYVVSGSQGVKRPREPSGSRASPSQPRERSVSAQATSPASQTVRNSAPQATQSSERVRSLARAISRGPSQLQIGKAPAHAPTPAAAPATRHPSSRAPPLRKQPSNAPPPGSDEMDALRRQIAELRMDNERMQVSLKEAKQVKLVKEGEVTILRQNIAQTAKQHIEQMAKMKAAKDEADSKQAAVRLEMKAEIERLKTQFTFKQHELEASVRRAPQSVAKRALARGVPATPVRMPTEMQAWNKGPNAHEKAKASAVPPPATQSSSPLLKRGAGAAPKPSLPGFQNAFSTNNSPSRRKEKQKEHNEDWPSSSAPPASPSRHRQAKKASTDHWLPSSPAGPSRFATQGPEDAGPSQWGADVSMSQNFPDVSRETEDPFGDVEMSVDIEQNAPIVDLLDNEENVDPTLADSIDLANLKHQMLQIIFSHVFPDSEDTLPTLQMLMNASSSMRPEVVDSYTQACSRFLEVLSSVMGPTDWNAAIRNVCVGLTEVLWPLTTVEDNAPLSAVINLLGLLTRTLPKFNVAVLSPSREEGLPSCTELISSIITSRLNHTNSTQDQFTVLAEQCLSLLEALCWNIPEQYEQVAASLLEQEMLLWTLIDRRQPTWFLSRASEIVLWLGTYSTVGELLLAQCEPPNNPRDPLAGVQTSIPYVERLCSLLSDIHHADSFEMQRAILSVVCLLSTTQEEGHELLAQSQVVIPLLVGFLYDLVAPVWEEEDSLVHSPEETSRHIRLLCQALYSVHHLVTRVRPMVDLRTKLYNTPSRCFPGARGMKHIVTLTLGRLSYADPPDWIPAEPKAELMMMAEIAQDLMGLIAEGPEADALWATFQGREIDVDSSGDQDVDFDDEEWEAMQANADHMDLDME